MPVRFKEDIHTTCDNCKSEVVIEHECEQCYDRENNWTTDELSEQYNWLRQVNSSLDDLRHQRIYCNLNDIAHELLKDGQIVLPPSWYGVNKFVCEYFKTDSRDIHLQLGESVWTFSAQLSGPRKVISTMDFNKWLLPIEQKHVIDVDNFISLISQK